MTYRYETKPTNGVGPEFREWVKWCEHNFGPDGAEGDYRWLCWYGTIKFSNAEDYSWFKLRWT